MTYILKQLNHIGGGQYRAKPGNRTPYTSKPHAREFTRKQAERERRANETIMPAREDY